MQTSLVKAEDVILSVLEENGFRMARIISGSKSGYLERYPGHEVYFNANILTEHGKIWYGDLDITKDKDALQKVATESRTDLYILREMDGRFGAENEPFEELKKKAVATFKSQL